MAVIFGYVRNKQNKINGKYDENYVYNFRNTLTDLTDDNMPGIYGTIPSYHFENDTILQKINLSKITKINEYAFSGCTNLKTIILNNLTDIQDCAFSGCSALVTVNLPNLINVDEWPINLQSEIYDGARTFSQCSNLTNFSATNLEYVAYDMFEVCSALTNVYFPKVQMIGCGGFFNTNLKQITKKEFPLLEAIGESAFNNCSNLEYINCELVKILSGNSFNNCIKLKYAILNSFEDFAYVCCKEVTGQNENNDFYSCFGDCTSLDYVIMPSVKNIAKETFGNCTNLKTVYIGSNIESIRQQGYYSIASFYNCTQSDLIIYIDKDKDSIVGAPWGATNAQIYWKNSDKVLVIDNIEVITTGQYHDNSNIEIIIIKSPVKEIQTNAFSNCINLKRVIFVPGLNSITIAQSAFYGCSNLTELILSNNVTSVAAYAFNNCINLKNICLSESLLKISEGEFQGCSSLECVDMFNPIITEIEDFAFKACISLTSIIIPSSVISIGANAFINCDKLTSITVHKLKDSISGAPWGATNATVIWDSQDTVK